MVSFPPCKINLGLSILNKRADGYHNLETCFYPVPWHDVLEIIKADVFQFTSSGILIPGSPEDNLCIKAYQLLKKDFNLDPVKIHLHKIIPMGAGLGGGSSDAAHTLLLLKQIFDLDLTQKDLRGYASRIGSDCAFFIQDIPMMGTGRGEILNPADLNLRGKFLVIIKPEVHISTAEAYAGVKPARPEISLEDIVRLPVKEWKGKLVNDFEKTVLKNHPEIKKVREKLYNSGALYASMSGSGSSVFGIFDQPVSLQKEFDSLTYWSGELTI